MAAHVVAEPFLFSYIVRNSRVLGFINKSLLTKGLAISLTHGIADFHLKFLQTKNADILILRRDQFRNSKQTRPDNYLEADLRMISQT